MPAGAEDRELAVMTFPDAKRLRQTVRDLSETGGAVSAEEAAAVLGVAKIHIARPEAAYVAPHCEPQPLAVKETGLRCFIGRAEVAADGNQADRYILERPDRQAEVSRRKEWPPFDLLENCSRPAEASPCVPLGVRVT